MKPLFYIKKNDFHILWFWFGRCLIWCFNPEKKKFIELWKEKYGTVLIIWKIGIGFGRKPKEADNG